MSESNEIDYDATAEESEIVLVEKISAVEEEGEFEETNLALGLTDEEVDALTQQWGKNEVIVEEDPWWFKLGSKYLGPVPLIMLVVALLSASIVNQW